jgi:hypothetical protein
MTVYSEIEFAARSQQAQQPEPTKPVVWNMYDRALLSQSACNLSGLVKSLAADIDAIWEEGKAVGDQSTDYVNRHPVVRLYIEQFCHLNGCGWPRNDEDNPYSKASAECREKAAASSHG